MSYASSVKEELAGQVPAARHCKIAEIAAIISLCGLMVIAISESILKNQCPLPIV